MRTLVAAALLLAAHAARADVAVRVVDAETPVLDGGVWDDRGGIADAPVRIVGDAVVVLVKTNPYGQFSLDGLPPGIYRVESDRGRLIEVGHGPVTIDPEPYRCDIWNMSRGRTFRDVLGAAAGSAPSAPAPPRPAPPRPAPPTPQPARRGHVDTTSTTQGTRVDAAALRALP